MTDPPRQPSVAPAPRWVEALLLVWLAILVLGPHPGTFLYGDSLHYAAVAKSTLAGGDWLALRLGEQPYFNKPPLLFWLAMLAFRVLGPTTFAAQLVGVVSGVLLMLATWELGKRLFDRRHGLLAALVLGTTYVFVRNASILRVDAWLALAVLGALAAVLAAERRPAWLPLFWACVAIGVVFKGPAGLLAVAVLILWSALRRRLWPFNALAFWATLPLVPLLVLPWVLHNHALFGGRFFSAYAADVDIIVSGNNKGPVSLKYATDLVTEAWPWLPFLLHGVWLAGRRWLGGQRDNLSALPLAWVTGVMAVLLALNSAYSRYVIPLLPASSLLTATSLLAIWPRMAGRRMLLVLGVILLAGTVVIVAEPIEMHADRTPDILLFQPLLRERGITQRIPVLEGRVSPTLQSAAIFYCDMLVDPLPPAQIKARVEAHPPLVAILPQDKPSVPPDVHSEVLMHGQEYDLLELRPLPPP